MMDAEYGKRGYLKENYRIFNINDYCRQDFRFHYHEFDKIILFKSGKASYIIEGKEYCLKPNDILLVRHGDIHKPVIKSNVPYERIVIWINSSFLKSADGLSACFDKAAENHIHLIRLADNHAKEIFSIIEKLIHEDSDIFAAKLMQDCIFTEFMILINRAVINYNGIPIDYKSDKLTDEIIEYINNHLSDDLTLDRISNEFYLNRYYLMHKFKRITGKTIYNYIISKRLIYSASLISSGETAKTACFESGFNNYSVFLKAFKKEFGCTPSEFSRQI